MSLLEGFAPCSLFHLCSQPLRSARRTWHSFSSDVFLVASMAIVSRVWSQGVVDGKRNEIE